MSDPALTPIRLVQAIEDRLARISGEMHRLARERAELQAHASYLRMAVLTSDAEAVLLRLRAAGIRLRGLEAAPRRKVKTP